MKPHAPEIDAIFSNAAGQFVRFHLYSFLLVGGGELTYCAGDQDVFYNGVRYSASGTFDGDTSVGGPYFDTTDNKAKLHQKIGTEVDTLVFDVLGGAAEVFGAPFAEAAQTGQFDAAEMTLSRVYMVGYNPYPLGFDVFEGRVAEVDTGRSKITFTVNSWLELLNQLFPRNLYQPGCVNNLGDSMCQVVLGPVLTNGTALSGSTSTVIKTAVVLPPSGTLAVWTLEFTSGALNGQTQTILSTVPGTSITVGTAFSGAPAAADTFVVTQSYTVAASASTGSTAAVINTSLTLPIPGYFDEGTITFTSGELDGLSRTALSVTSSAITLLGPFPSAPAPGDTFTITAGCDKTSGLPINTGQDGATMVNGSPDVTLAEPLVGLVAGMPITGSGFVPSNTFVQSVDGTFLVMTNAATNTGQTDLTFGTSQNGCGKFDNIIRFRGDPFVPTPATAI